MNKLMTWISNSTSMPSIWTNNFKIKAINLLKTMAPRGILASRRKQLGKMDSKWGLEGNWCNRKEATVKGITGIMLRLGYQVRETNLLIKENIEWRVMGRLFPPIYSWLRLVSHIGCRWVVKLFRQRMLRIQGKLDFVNFVILSFINL